MPKASISLTPFIIWVPLFYLVLLSFPPPGPLVLLSPTQFCPFDKHFLNIPPLSSTQFSGSRCMSHGSWLVDSSTYACTVGSFMIGRSVYLSLPRWMHTERRAEHIPTNPGSRIFLSPISSLTPNPALLRSVADEVHQDGGGAESANRCQDD